MDRGPLRRWPARVTRCGLQPENPRWHPAGKQPTPACAALHAGPSVVRRPGPFGARSPISECGPTPSWLWRGTSPMQSGGDESAATPLQGPTSPTTPSSATLGPFHVKHPVHMLAQSPSRHTPRMRASIRRTLRAGMSSAAPRFFRLDSPSRGRFSRGSGRRPGECELSPSCFGDTRRRCTAPVSRETGAPRCPTPMRSRTKIKM